MKHTLKGWLFNNPFAATSEEKMILRPESAGNLTLADIFDRMKEQDTGLRQETIEHAVKLYHRVLTESILEGHSVNTGLFRAAPCFRGVVRNGLWDPEKNAVYVSFVQDKELREAIAETAVDILGEKGDVMYITGGEDTATHATDGTATAGRNYILHGRMLKVAGDHESTGVTLTGSDGRVTPIPRDRLVLNMPSRLIILLPDDLQDGEYMLTVTTQFSNTSALLKTPHSAGKTITIG